MSFAKNLGKSIGTNINRSVSSKCSPGMLATHQKLFDHAKQSATNIPKTALKRAIQKTAEATGDLTGSTIADKITKVWRSTPQNSSESIENEIENTGFDREIYVSPEKY